MEAWMRDNSVREVWVGAGHRNAIAFYRALGFAAQDPGESDLPAHRGSVFMDKVL
jgi:hypothetical protein